MGRSRLKLKHLPRRMQLKAGTYWYVYRKDGKYVWEKLGREYGVALLKWAEIEGHSPNSGRTVAHAIAHYIETERGRLKAKTVSGYQHSAANLIGPFGKMGLGDLTANDVYEYLRRAGNIQANRDKALLSAVYTAARSWGWYAGESPAIGVRRNPERARTRYVTDSELSALIVAAKPQMACMIRLAYLTGLREGDVLKIRFADIWEDGIYVQHGKTAAKQLIEWTDELRSVVTDAKALKRKIGSLYLFAGRKGQPYTGDGFRAMWRRVKIRAGLKDVTFHDLRRKAASDVSLEHAKSLLLHQSEATTRKHYRAKPERAKPVR
jgi:integrase